MSDPNRKYHDRVAARYDDIYAKDPYWDYYFEVSWRDLRKSLPRDLAHPVLDLGCGTGKYGLKLLKSGFKTVFSDLSPKMVDVAARKAAEEFPGRPAEFTAADIVDLAPFPDRHFSLLVAQGDPLSFASDVPRALANIYRVLVPKGRAVLSVDSRFGGMDPLLAGGEIAELEGFLRTGDSRWLARKSEERFSLHAFTPEELGKLSADAGFAVRSLIGKTLFDLRGGHRFLAEPDTRRRLLDLEAELGGTSGALGRAHHLQITLERPGDGEAGEASPDDPARAAERRGPRRHRFRRR